MPALYSALDVFVLPSHREGFSRSAMEAAACGLPLVLTDIRGCREVGPGRRRGVLVPPRDADALTEAVERLLADRGLREGLGAAGAVAGAASVRPAAGWRPVRSRRYVEAVAVGAASDGGRCVSGSGRS